MPTDITLKALALLLMVSCGEPAPIKKDASHDQPSPPQGLIIAVHRNETGEHIAQRENFRIITKENPLASPELLEDRDLPVLYKHAQKPARILSQQQYDPSDTEQQGWLHYRQCPEQVVRLRVAIKQDPIILRSCLAYHVYQPVFLFQGIAHRFFFHGAYRLGNVTYYYYSDIQTQTRASAEPDDESEQHHQPEQKHAA